MIIWQAIIQTLRVQIGREATTVKVVAKLLEGQITAGMYLEIPLNRSTAVSNLITQVTKLSSERIELILEAEDSDGAALIESLNFVDEMLVITSISES